MSKLYATVASEKAQKGQGGQKYLEIFIKDEREITFARLLVSKEGNVFYPTIEIISNGRVDTVFTDEELDAHKERLVK